MTVLDAEGRVRVAALSHALTHTLKAHLNEWPDTTLDEMIAAFGEVLQDAAIDYIDEIVNEPDEDDDDSKEA